MNENTAIQTIEEDTNTAIIDASAFRVCTIDMDSDDDKMAFVKGYNSATPLSENVGVVINLKDVVCVNGIRKGRNGMPDTPCVNTYMMSDDGQTYYSQSDGVARSVMSLVAMFPTLTYEGRDYIPVVCEEKQLSNGNTLKSIVPAI